MNILNDSVGYIQFQSISQQLATGWKPSPHQPASFFNHHQFMRIYVS